MAEIHPLSLAIFIIITVATLLISIYASRRVRTAGHYYVAGGGVRWFVNGFAIAGDYLSAASFLDHRTDSLRRLRRLHLRHRLPGRLDRGAVPGGHAAAGHREVHLRRRSYYKVQEPQHPPHGRHQHAGGLGVLPHTTDGRFRLHSGTADRPGL